MTSTDNNKHAVSQAISTPTTEPMPKLWNPSAAVNWSLLLTPAFGAYLQMKNWQRLGESANARTSKAWLIATLCHITWFFLTPTLIPASAATDNLFRTVGLALLFGWYFHSGKLQNKYVLERYGKNYPRLSFIKPLWCAFLLILGRIAIDFTIIVISELLIAVF